MQLPGYNVIRKYVLDHFLMRYSVEANLEIIADLCHTRFEEPYQELFYNIDKLNPIFFQWNGYHFPVFFYDYPTGSYTDGNKLTFDLYLNSYLLLSGWQEWLIQERDNHNRFDFYNSLQFKFNFITTPVVDLYFKLFAQIIRNKGVKVKERTNYNCPIVMTHDIDQLRSGYLTEILNSIKNLTLQSIVNIPKSFINLFFSKDDIFFKNVDYILDAEKKTNVNSVFFMMTVKGKHDADYDIIEPVCRKLIDRIIETGSEVQLHPGYDSYNDIEAFKAQQKLMQSLLPYPVNKVRQHFLRFDVSETPAIHEESGITEDYSLYFAGHYGFRNSTCSPFYLFRFDEGRPSKVLSIPTVFMDGTLVQYIKDNRSEHIKLVIEMIKKTSKDFPSRFAVLFHNVFGISKYSGMKEMYEEILQLIGQHQKSLLSN